jgi:hypothetical protein
MITFANIIVLKLLGVTVLCLALPLIALTYYCFRRHRREAEIKRIFSILKMNQNSDYGTAYEPEKLADDLLSIAYTFAVSYVGLTVLFLGGDMGFSEAVSHTVEIGTAEFPHEGSRLVFGMAFLGAYVWGLQNVFRRYSLNDLIPSVYYGLSTRMIFASSIALVVFNAYTALSGNGDSGEGGITSNIWPALAFLIGMFPQNGLRWLTDRLPMLSQETHPSVRKMPLEMIEGIEAHDVLRLEELGIDTCHDLANIDFVPLVLKTPYSARQLIDWILQAKLCIYFGDAVKDLRQHGIRTLLDLEPLREDQIAGLASGTTLTQIGLEQAQEQVKKNNEIKRLCEIGKLLGRFWESDQETTQV